MKNFELYNPVRVIFGVGESDDIAKRVTRLGRRALIVSYASHGFLNDLINRVETSLHGAGIETVSFYRIQANPLLSHIREGAALCVSERIDFCIGIGGGSVMDSTKAIAAGALYRGDLWRMFVSRHDSEVAVPPTETLPTVMLPTLPATSSEMNCIAVATNDETSEKAYIMTPVIYPDTSIIDPALTRSLPPFQTAVGAVDAMSHVLEAYLNGDQNSPLQDRLHEGILTTIMSELPEILKNPDDLSHRANIQWASSLAWNGYLQSGLNATTPMHQMGHVLSALYNTTHGVTLAIFMDSYFRYTSSLNPERAARFALLGRKLFGFDPSLSDTELAKRTVDRIIAFMDSVGVPHTFTAAGVPSGEISKIADEIVRHGCDANGNLPSIPPIGRDGITAILRMSV